MRWAREAVDRSRAESGSDSAPAEPGADASATKEPGNRLGRILVEQGHLHDDQIAGIVAHARKTSQRFGEAAIDLRLVSRDDVEQALAAQFEYPFLGSGLGGYPEDLVAAYRPFSPKGQALRNLRTRILQQWVDRSRHALAILSTKDGEGRSYITSNLAVVFSQLGERTLIVDADLLHSRQHRIFNVPNDVGLSAVLVGRMPASRAIVPLPLFRGLSILPAGAPPPNAAELLGRKELRRLVTDLEQQFDILIFDTSPTNVDASAELVAAACGSAIMVVRQNRSLLEESESLAGSLRKAGVNLIGSVFSSF